MMKLLAATFALSLLVACSQSQAPAPAPAAAGTAAVPAVAASSALANGESADTPDEVMPPRSAAQLSAAMLHKVLAAPGRSAAERKLDAVRHPAETLAFFGLQPDMNVIEVAPHKGWYAAILAPLLARNGTYTAAMVSGLSSPQAATARDALQKRFSGVPALFGHARIATFDPHTPNLGTSGSADMVLSFCDLRAWINAGRAQTMFKAMFDVLRPGGVLGIVANRAGSDTDAAALKDSSYVRQDQVVKLATDAGFKLAASSAVNANPADARTAHPAPADADRMTLRFVKPATPSSAASS